MPTIEESIIINRPREEVFAWLAEPGNQPLYQSNLTSFEQIGEGPMEKGAQARGVTRVAGRNIEWTSEFTEFEAPSRVSFRSIEGPVEFTGTWIYEEVPEGTKLTYQFEPGTLGGVFGKLADPLVTRMYARDVHANLENLKEILEAE